VLGNNIRKPVGPVRAYLSQRKWDDQLSAPQNFGGTVDLSGKWATVENRTLKMSPASNGRYNEKTSGLSTVK